MYKYVNANNSNVRQSDKQLNYPWILVHPKPDEKDIEGAIEYIESNVLSGMDWLGTGSSQVMADLDENQAWQHWNIIREALGLTTIGPCAVCETNTTTHFGECHFGWHNPKLCPHD
jgi:hypothetical protein